MMSKISYSKLIREDIKKRAWLLLLSITAFVIIIPILSAIQIEGALPGGVSGTYTNWKDVQSWFVTEMGFSNKYIWFAVCAGGILSAITSFSYLHSKKQIDFYHCLPVKRETWYFVNCISGIVQIIVPYIIGYILMLIVGGMKGVASPKLIRQSGVVMGITILIFLLIYGTTSLAMILTGKLLVGMLGATIFLMWGSVIVALKNYTMLQLFENYMTEETVVGFVENMIGGGGWYSPILIWERIKNYNHLGKPMFPIVMAMILAIILIFAVGLFAFKKRRMENVGKAIVFSKVESLVQIIITVTSGMFFAVIVSSQNQVKGMKVGWMYGIAMISVVIIYGVISFIYHGDIRMLFQKKIPLCICMAVTLGTLTIVRFDVLGYDKYMPDKNKIKMMAVDSYDVNYLLNYRSQWENLDYKGQLAKLKTEEFNDIYDLIEESVRGKNDDDTEKSIINVGYYLNSGRKIYRSYQVDEEKLFRCIDKMMLDEQYKSAVLNVGEIDASKINSIHFENIRTENLPIQLNEKEREDLFDAYCKDMEKYPLSEIVDGEIVGRLYCKGHGEERVLYVFEEYQTFIDTLRKYCEVPNKITQQEVKSITIEDYRKPNNMKDITIQPEDAEKIQSILDSLTYTEIGTSSGETEPNLYVTVVTENGITSAFIKKNEIPKFLNE